MLAIELQGLIDLDFSIELTGFEMVEVDLLLYGEAEAKAPDRKIEDGIPPLPALETATIGASPAALSEQLILASPFVPVFWDLVTSCLVRLEVAKQRAAHNGVNRPGFAGGSLV